MLIRRGRRRGLGLATGLVLVAFVPTAALAAVEVANYRDHAIAAQRARELAANIERSRTEVELRVALRGELVPYVMLVEGSNLGFTADQLSELLRFDVGAEVVRSQAATDAALAQMPGDRDGLDLEWVTRARQTVGTKEASVDAVQAGYTNSDRVLRNRIAGRRAQAWLSLSGVDGESVIANRLLTMDSAIDLIDATLDELRLLFERLKPTAEWTSSTDGTTLLGTATVAGFTQTRIESLVATGTRTARELDRFRTDTEVRRFEEEAAGFIDGTSNEVLTPTQTALIFADGLDLLAHLGSVVRASIDDVSEVADRLVADAEARQRESLLIMCAVLAGTIVLTFAVTRWVTRPLDRLERQASRVNAGELDLPPLGRGGPREVWVIASTVNALTAALRRARDVLEAPAAAAATDGGDGPLGAAVGGAAVRLAEALHDLEVQARIDLVTGLENRFALSARLLGERAVIVLDLDGFKEVNDTLGHATGDALLREVARTLMATVRTEDRVYRLGGDEFAVVLPAATSADEAMHVAHRLVDALGRPFLVDGLRLQVGASAGVTVNSQSDRLLADADLALYEAKRMGKARAVLFVPAMYESVARSARMRRDLDHALAGDQLRLVYQPVHDLATGSVAGLEALLRWLHPEHGNVPPATFVPVAEASGQIAPIGAWVLETAVDALTGLKRTMPALTMAVNVSPRQLLDHEFANRFRRTVEQHRLAAGDVVLELTESMLITDPAQAAAALGRLRDAGARIAIDDYGSGNASVSYLRQFPVDVIKLDRSLVQCTTATDRAVLAAIVDLADALSIDVVAEGVETPEQLETVRDQGCRWAQGYLFSPPLEASGAADYLATRTSGSGSAVGSSSS